MMFYIIDCSISPYALYTHQTFQWTNACVTETILQGRLF